MWDAQLRVRLSVAALLLAVAVCLVYIVRAVSDTSAALPSSETGAPSPAGTQVLHTRDELRDDGRGQLTQYSVLRVRVVDEGQDPIEGATVTLEESPPQEDAIGEDRASATATVRTAVDGRCELTVRRDGAPYLLIASAAGFRAETRKLAPRGEAAQEVTIILTAGLGPDECRVSGVVMDQHGNGISNAEVTAFYGYPEGGNATSRRTKEDGVFSMGGLKPGECRLAACLYVRKAEGGERNIPLGWPDTPLVTFDLRGGEHKKGVKIVLPKYSLWGRVSNERGVGVAQARVVVKQKEMPLAEARSQTGGGFSITGIILFEGGPVVDVECIAAGYDPTQLTGIPLDTANLQIVLQPAPRGGIRGTVCDALTRQPVAGARVAVGGGTSESGERWGWASREMETTTNAQGMFAMEGVRAGLVHLIVYAQDYGLQELHVDVARERTTELDIPLSRAGILKVNLTREDTAELPIIRFQIKCYPPGLADSMHAHGLDMRLQRWARGEKLPDPSLEVGDGDELQLAPGAYDVHAYAVSIGNLQTAQGLVRCESQYGCAARVIIESGRTTELAITVGSPSYVLISTKPRSNTSTLIATIIPADSPPFEQVFGSSFPYPEKILQDRSYREYHMSIVGVDASDGGRAVWIGILNVKPGSYRLYLYEREGSSKPCLRSTSMIHVSANAPSVAEFE